MSKFFNAGFVLFLTAALVIGSVGCSGGGDSANSQGSKPTPANRVDWSAVPSEYNPKIVDTEFRTDGFEKIRVDAFSYKGDAEVVYTNDVSPGSGYLRLYTVYKDSASWGSLQPRPNGTALDLINYGSYQCSIRVANGRITDLKGGCYVRLQVLLPVGSEIEVYNVGQLITKRFIPIKTDEFLNMIDSATWAADKFAVIENFLASYRGISMKPSLTSRQLGDVVGEFSWKEEKNKVLGRLHSIVSDRENLGKMIEDKFSYFDREEARRIVGL